MPVSGMINLIKLSHSLMSLVRLSEQRDLFITDNMIIMLELPDKTASDYAKALSIQDDHELSRIENMVDHAMKDISVNYWHEYILMVAHFIFREHKSDIVACLLRDRPLIPARHASVPYSTSCFVLTQRFVDGLLMAKYEPSTPRRILSISQAIEDAAYSGT